MGRGAISQVMRRFKQLQGRYGPQYTKAMLGAAFVALFSPIPGFVNPRKIVGREVQRVLVDANWILIGGMRRTSLRIVMQLAFGLSLWLTWAFALRGGSL
jgi:hypothetical protein